MHKTVIKARDVMRTDYVEIDGLATVSDAINEFKNNQTRVLIVRKRDENDAFGIVLLSDIVKKVLAMDRAIERVNVYEIMSKPVISIDPEMDVRYCARLFSKFGISHTVVTEAGQVIGIVGYMELLMPWYE